MNSELSYIMDRIWARRVPFFAVFFLVTLITYAFLYWIDFIPEPVEEGVADDTEAVLEVVDPNEGETRDYSELFALFLGRDDDGELIADDTETRTVSSFNGDVDPLPVKIIFDDLDGKTVDVLNPTSRTIADLDEALLSGAVRHPDSADFSDPGNIFILAHSSYLPNVLNKNFQAFNGIQKLDWGDTIRLQSGDMEYTYLVEDVYKATTDVVVPHTPGKANLTLATCNSFGSKDDRFMVEAKLVSQKPL